MTRIQVSTTAEFVCDSRGVMRSASNEASWVS